MKGIAFISNGDGSRVVMAAGFARSFVPEGTTIICATPTGGSPSPAVIAAMKESGIDVSDIRIHPIDDLENSRSDLVVAICEKAREACPPMPGTPPIVTWNIHDPAAPASGPKEAFDTVSNYNLRSTRDSIEKHIEELFSMGYFKALSNVNTFFESVLNNLSDGIIVHDFNKRILHFNKAAEKITGHTAADVIGKSCHDIFPGGFCGPKCNFCDESAAPKFNHLEYPITFISKSGEKKIVEMSVVPLINESGISEGVIATFKDITRVTELEKRLEESSRFGDIIGKDPKMQSIYNLIRDISESEVPILIGGETGTGKEMVAAAIHTESRRANQLFVPVNCGALPEGTIESELFGHVRGAFTGAIRDKKGRFELADGGTIFLDEVGELPLNIQVKLLRVLQEGTFERVGDEITLKTNVRVISATNRDLKTLMSEGKFREDLYYRLCVVPIELPALRERRTDIPLLADFFLKKLAAEAGRKNTRFSANCMDLLLDYSWPGNVRQLQNTIQFSLLKSHSGVIEPHHLPPEIYSRDEPEKGKPGRKMKLTGDSVKQALEQAGGNKVKAAKILNVGRATLYRFMDSNL